MAGLSVPGNSCCGSTVRPQTGCVTRLSGQCVYYSGTNIPASGVNTGDLLDTVIQKLSAHSGSAGTFVNGLFNNSGVIQFGQPIGQSGNPAQLLAATEVPTNTFDITFPGSLNNTSTISDSGDITAGRVLQASGFRSFGSGQGFGVVISRTSTDATGDARGFADQTGFTGSDGIAYAAFDAAPQLFNAGAVVYDHLIGFQARGVFDSVGGAINNLYGFGSFMASKNGGTNNYYDFYAEVMNSNSGVSPTVQNRYNFYAAGDTRAVNNWGVYIDGAQNNYMGLGVTLIGTTNIQAGGYALQVATDVILGGVVPMGYGNTGNPSSGNIRFGQFTMNFSNPLAVTGVNNSAIGTGCLGSLTSGSRNHMLGHQGGLLATTASFNAGVGESVLQNLTTGTTNAALGYFALFSLDVNNNCTGVGAGAGYRSLSTYTGDWNTFLGAGTTFSANGLSLTMATAVGAQAVLSQSNTVIIGTGTESVGIGTSTPTSKVDITGINPYAQLRLRSTYTPTSSSDANGNTGDIAWDTGFIYVKTGPGAWKRATLSTF